MRRRSFLWGSVGSAALLAAPRLVIARGLLTDATLDDVLQRTLVAAKKAGASYCDVRIVRHRNERVSTREDKVQQVASSEEYGLGVRVIAGGAWGFAATPAVIASEGERAARLAVDLARANAPLAPRPVDLGSAVTSVDVWQTPLVKDPFKIPLGDKADLLLAINREALKVPGVKFVSSYYAGNSEWKLLATSEGAYVEQEITRLGPGFTCTAVDDKRGEFQTRDHDIPPRQAGWEYVEDARLVDDARRVGEEAVEKLKAAQVSPGKRDLILHPSNLWLTIHESIGHSTELDRAMGMEANMAGTSFATPDKLGKLRMAAPHLTFYADRNTAGGLATSGYDDEGVPAQRWNLVERGILVGYQTTREQAAWLPQANLGSRGTSYGDSYASFPFQRMPNVSLAPGATEQSFDDIIAQTDDAIAIVGRGSWSIDHQRYNFQFGGQAFYEIKHGKRVRMLRDVAYQANTIAFWTSCDLIGGPSSWQLHGTLSDGKGEPGQSNAVSHGCPPARFRGVDILDTGRRTA